MPTQTRDLDLQNTESEILENFRRIYDHGFGSIRVKVEMVAGSRRAVTITQSPSSRVIINPQEQ